MKKFQISKAIRLSFHKTVVFGTVFLSTTVLYAQACDELAFYDALAQSESGGCEDPYTCMGPVISSGMHAGTRPIGRYQFMPLTLQELGIPVEGFAGNAAAQENAIRLFNERNNNCLNSSYTLDGVTYPPASASIGTVINGVTITRSGLLGASHLSGCGGARRMIRSQGSGSSDQLGTSALDYAARFGGYNMFGDVPGGTCGGGVPNAADVFVDSQVQGLHNLLGCDPEILERGEVITDALDQVNAEIIRASIQPPSSVEELTCLDQQLRVLDAAGDIHATPGNTLSGGNDGTQIRFDNLTYNPLEEQLSSLMDIPGSISSIVNNIWSSLVGSFDPTSALTGGTSTNCDVMEQTWMLNQCIELPQLPSLSDVITGRIGELSGAITSAPDRILEQVCSAASSQLGLATGDISSMFDNAADDALTPITDSLP